MESWGSSSHHTPKSQSKWAIKTNRKYCFKWGWEVSCAPAKLLWLSVSSKCLTEPQDVKLRMFTMKESSFASYDLRRECKHDSWADKEVHIAAVCMIVSDKLTHSIVSVMCTAAPHWQKGDCFKELSSKYKKVSITLGLSYTEGDNVRIDFWKAKPENSRMLTALWPWDWNESSLTVQHDWMTLF